MRILLFAIFLFALPFTTVFAQPNDVAAARPSKAKSVQSNAINNSLINANLTHQNVEDYYHNAVLLFEAGRVKDAKPMLEHLLQCKFREMNRTNAQGAEVSVENSKTTSPNAQCTVHPKNKICVYLAKIALQEKDFAKALHYAARQTRLMLIFMVQTRASRLIAQPSATCTPRHIWV
jgi:hypothetical protein